MFQYSLLSNHKGCLTYSQANIVPMLAHLRKYKFEFKISSSIFVTLLVLAKLSKFLFNDNLFLQNKSSKYKTNFKKARLRLFRCKITLVQVCRKEGDDATFYIYYRDAKNNTNLFLQIQTFEFAIPHST